MIPKKIHYCWLSNDPMPQQLQKCVDSWKKILPDYEIVKWDLNRFPLVKSLWVKQAFEAKKYAFAADYIRLYALATEGGIYLDSDVEVLKSFDDLLHLPYFICRENSPQGIEAATMGAEVGIPWIKECLASYKGKSFINDDGTANTMVLPRVLKENIEKKNRIHYISSKSEFGQDKGVIYVFPSDYFSPKNYVTKKISVTTNTYSIHHFAGTWVPLWKKVLLRIWVPFTITFPKVAEKIKKHGIL